jgi:hypothetical protein
MNTESNEWRELEAYVTKRCALLLEELGEKESPEKRIERKTLLRLLKDLGAPKRAPVQPIDFGLKND